MSPRHSKRESIMARFGISTSSKSGNSFIRYTKDTKVIQNKSGKTYATKGGK